MNHPFLLTDNGRYILESVTDSETTPTAVESASIAEFNGRLPVERHVYRCAVELIIQANNAIYTDKGSVAVFVAIYTDVCTGADIPSKAGGAGDIAMDLIQTGETNTVSPEIRDQFTRVPVVEKMFQRDAAAVPYFNAQCSPV